MTWQPLDCHAHTTMSDGELSPAALVEAVRARGVRPSVADHVSRDVRGSVKTIDGVRVYLDELGRHDVMRGAEFCWHDGLWRELPDEIWRRFTHCLGSLHAVIFADGRRLHAFTGAWPDGLTEDAYMDVHIDNVERFAREMPVDILAHPTLVPMRLRARDPEDLWTEAREERTVAALWSAGIAFEVSNRYRPHRRLVQRAVARGVRLSLGSDGHAADQVGDVSWPLSLARELGVDDDVLYDPAADGSRTQR